MQFQFVCNMYIYIYLTTNYHGNSALQVAGLSLIELKGHLPPLILRKLVNNNVTVMSVQRPCNDASPLHGVAVGMNI